MAPEGHLDCMFDCGLKFFSLEDMYLHVELDHREDNTVSPFAVHNVQSSPGPHFSREERAPPLPSRPPPPLPGRPSASAAPSSNGKAAVSAGSTIVNGAEQERYMLCPEKDCGELILIIELNEHLDLHDAEKDSIDEDSPSSLAAPRSSSRHSSSYHSSSHQSSKSSSNSRFTTSIDPALRSKSPSDSKPREDGIRATINRKMRSLVYPGERFREPSNKAPVGKTKRLGTAELGPYAYEKQMPGWMYRKLEAGPKVTKTRRITRSGGLVTHESVEGQTNGVLPILRRLIDIDENVYKAYLCHPSVTQVGKTNWETGFCGFRNSQMLISYVQNSKHPANTLFPGHIPGILDIQDWIEAAWAEGIHSYAREEMGGLRGTRKWIGTLEVDALLQYMGIPHGIQQFHDTLEVDGRYAEQNLLKWVEQYFAQAAIDDGRTKVMCTLKPPIYFQRPGHSLTIVGLERMRDGSRNLLVFDPMYQIPTSMLQLIESQRVKAPNDKLLRFYRRSQSRLEQYQDFEATTLEGELPEFPAWNVIKNFPTEDVFATIVNSNWEVLPLKCFVPEFQHLWHHFGDVFLTQEARYARSAPLLEMWRPGRLWTPDHMSAPMLERLSSIRGGDQPMTDPGSLIETPTLLSGTPGEGLAFLQRHWRILGEGGLVASPLYERFLKPIALLDNGEGCMTVMGKVATGFRNWFSQARRPSTDSGYHSILEQTRCMPFFGALRNDIGGMFAHLGGDEGDSGYSGGSESWSNSGWETIEESIGEEI